MRTRTTWAAVWAMSVVLLAMLLLSSQAAAGAGTTYVTLYGRGAITALEAWLWRGAQVTRSWQEDGTLVRFSVDDGKTAYQLEFAAAPGETLTPGTYTGAQLPSSREAGHPGINVYNDANPHTRCTSMDGSFTVHELAADLSRVSIDYEAHCDGLPVHVARGQIRYGVPPTSVSMVASPAVRYFERVEVGSFSITRPVRLHNLGTTPTSITSAAVTSGPFRLASNGCGALAVGATCTLNVVFRPVASGTFEGNLRATTSTGSTVDIGLSGYTGWQAPRVFISVPRTTYTSGETVPITAQVNGTYKEYPSIKLFMTEAGGQEKYVETAPVDADGFAHFSHVARKNVVYSVWWSGEFTRHPWDAARVKVGVRARVLMSLYRPRTKSGAYWLYSRPAPIVAIAHVGPSKAGKCVDVATQKYVDGAWRALAFISCGRLDSYSRYWRRLDYRSPLYRVPLRFRARFNGDAANLAATSAWIYVKWSN